MCAARLPIEIPSSPSTVARFAAALMMKLYAIRRPGLGSREELEAAAARSRHVGDDEMSNDIRWIRSYVVVEADGRLGTICIYLASSPEKVREHALRAGIPATEVWEVADTLVVRPDPVPAAA
jgi:Protein of unknown function (DUF4242)